MNLFRVILPVADIEGAAKFYSSVLGLAGERVSPGRHYFASKETAGVVLACYSPREDGDATEHGDSWTPHPFQYLYFSAEDLHSARDRCLSAGATGVTDIEPMPWGETLFYAVDPYGNPISFVQAGTEFMGSEGDA